MIVQQNSPTKISDNGDYLALRECGLFCQSFFQGAYWAKLKGASDPLQFFLERGVADGLNPNPWFDTKRYLEQNKDVAQSSWHPVLHFALYGWKELRSPSASYDLVWHWVMDSGGPEDGANPLLKHCAEYSAGAPSSVRSRGKLTDAEETAFTSECLRIIGTGQLTAGQLSALGVYATEYGIWSVAEVAYQNLTTIKPQELSYHIKFADAVEKQGRTWQLADILEAAVLVAPENGELQARLGDVNERLARYPGAAEAYRHALALKPDNADWAYRLGFNLQKVWQFEEAEAAYAAAIRHTKKPEPKKFGIGAFHQARGLWVEAAEAYAAQARKSPFVAELRYVQAIAEDRCYRWGDAEQSLRLALALDGKQPYWHYKLGFVLERQGRLKEASEAYLAATLTEPTHKGYWAYRAAYCLDLAGLPQEACALYLLTDATYYAAKKKNKFADISADHLLDAQSSAGGRPDAYLDAFGELSQLLESAEFNHTDAAVFFKFGSLLEERLDQSGAAVFYEMAIARSAKHNPDWYYRLGRVLTRAGQWEPAAKAFREGRIYQRPFGVDTAVYQKNPAVDTAMEFTEFAETLSVAPKTILYEAYHGASVSCNPYAIFEALLSDPDYSDWTHVWAVNDFNVIPERYSKSFNKKIIWIKRNTSLYRRYLATASHLINNNTFMPWYYRREDQKYLMTWHGTPVKTLGKSIRGGFMEHKNATRNFLQATHLVSPNRYTADLLLKEYELDDVAALKSAETGYPRIDLMLNASDLRQHELREQLGLDSGRPVVLYAPTWRGNISGAQVDIDRLIHDVSAIAAAGFQLLFRGHHMMEKALAGTNLPVRVASQLIDTCELLSVVDVLISDYSSIVFDFFPSRRPIICYAYDKEEYIETRGLYLDLDSLPMRQCFDVEQVVNALRIATSGMPIIDDAVVQQAIDSYCYNEDGASTSRVIDFFLNDSEEHLIPYPRSDKKTILFYAGAFIPNGITTSILNLTDGLAKQNNLAIALDPDSIDYDPQRLEKLGELPQNIKKYARVGILGSTPEERWINDSLNRRYELPSSEMAEIYNKSFAREYRRMFGSAQFDVLIQFDGYSRFWGSVLAAGRTAEMRNVIYLHNDMNGERETRFPYLEAIFNLYPRYDSLISVSASVNEFNREALADRYQIDRSKFTYCDNVLNVDRIIELADEPLVEEIEAWIGDAGKVFCTLGRLSPEKDHLKLIQAFSDLVAVHEDVKLVIAGDGPLRGELQADINQKGLKDKVLLAGQLMNPYPLLKRSDLFVFSSNYEGQGIVILEALALGKPVVSTDVVGPRSILEGGEGLLVENSAQGLTAGMQQFLDGEMRSKRFDAKAYRASALHKFSDVIEGLFGGQVSTRANRATRSTAARTKKKQQKT